MIRSNVKHFLTGLAITIAGVAMGATFNQFSPASGVLKGDPSTPVTTAAVSSDIRAMWSGLCDATTFLRGDGSCAMPSSTPAGSTTQVQFNNAGAFGADSDFTWNSTTNVLTLANVTLSSATGSVFGSATGGAQGAGTINATGLFINGAAVGTGAGSVTSVALTAPAIFTVGGSPITTAGTLTLTASGTSGGVPYFSAANVLSSSAALTADRLMLGGGAGAAPTVLTAGTTTTVLHGNAAGAPTFGAVGLTTDVTGTLPFGNGGTGLAAAADDTAMVSSGAAWVATNIPNCVDSGGNHLNYTTATNAFSCGTIGPGGFTGFANPTATIGLTAVNGSAVTAMRSDGAPALSQAIAPTWTNTHVFTAIGSSSADTVQLASTLPMLRFTDTDAVADAKNWQAFASGNFFTLRTSNDANSAASNILQATRSGSAVTVADFGNTSDNPAYNFLGTGAVTTGGPFRAPDGSAGAPSFSFSGDTDTGMYRVGPNAAGLVAGGTRSIYFDATTAGFLSGTAGAPGISFQSDADTGLYLQAAGDARMVTSGTGRMIWTDSINYSRVPFQNVDGSVGTPAFSFENDSDTGFYRIGTNTIGVSTGGALMASFNGQLNLSDGTVGSPAFTFLNDTDTGIYRIASNVGGLVAGGAFSMFWDTVSIAVPDGTSGTPAIRFNNDGDTGFYRSGSGAVNLSSNGVNQGTICTSSGAGCAGSSGATGTFTGTLTGMSASCTATVSYKLANGLATIYVAAGTFTCTSNASSLTMTGLPAAIQPTIAVSGVTGTIDNGIARLGFYDIASAGSTITFSICTAFTTCSGGLYTASGTKGLPSGYSLQFPVN